MASPRKRGGSRPSGINTSVSKSVRFTEDETDKRSLLSNTYSRPPTPGVPGPQSGWRPARRSGLQSRKSAAQAAAQKSADKLHYETQVDQKVQNEYRTPTVEDEKEAVSATVEQEYQSPTYIDSSIPLSAGAGDAQKSSLSYTQETPRFQEGADPRLTRRQQESSSHQSIAAQNIVGPKPQSSSTSSKKATTTRESSAYAGPQNQPPPVLLSQQDLIAAAPRLLTRTHIRPLGSSNGPSDTETLGTIISSKDKNLPRARRQTSSFVSKSPAPSGTPRISMDLGNTSGRIEAISMSEIPNDFKEETVLTNHHNNTIRQRRQLVEAACNLEALEISREAVEARKSRCPDEITLQSTNQLLGKKSAAMRVATTRRNRERARKLEKPKKYADRKDAKDKKASSFWGRLFSRKPAASDKKVKKSASGATRGDLPDSSESDPSDDDRINSNGKRPRSAYDKAGARSKRNRRAPETPDISEDEFIFPPHPVEGYNDKSYDDAFYQLYNKLYDCVEKYFGPQYNLQHLLWPTSNEAFETARLWKMRLWDSLPTEFINWIEMVADGDSGSESGKDWSSLFLDPIERTTIICAVISKIIEVKIFGELLFGATVLENNTLKSAEESLALNEGFTRTEVRSKTVCAIMGPYILTANFNTNAEELTRQLFILLRPLNDWLAQVPLPDGTKRQQVQEGSQFKDLKSIVKGAGFISLMIRRSPNIFHFVSATPGSYYDKEDHLSINGPFYKASKQMIQDRCEQARKYYAEWAQKATRDDISALPYIKPQMQATVKIGITPTIRIYKPGRNPAAGPPREEHLFGEDGFRVFLLRQAATLCQWDITNFEEYEHRPKQNLKDYITFLKYPPGTKPPMSWRSHALLATGVAAAATAAFLLYLSQNGDWSLYGASVSKEPALITTTSTATFDLPYNPAFGTTHHGSIITQLPIHPSLLTSTTSLITIFQATYTLQQATAN